MVDFKMFILEIRIGYFNCPLNEEKTRNTHSGGLVIIIDNDMILTFAQ